jgi:hypothetical protein
LKVNYYQNAKANRITNEFVAWGKVAPAYNDFASSVIKGHPMEYTQYYLFPNMQNFFLPLLEKLEVYNTGQDHVQSNAAKWFHWKTNKLTYVSQDVQGTILFLFPAMFMLSNLLLLVGAMLFLIKRGWKRQHKQYNIMQIIPAAFLICNFLFSTLASPIVMRYQVLPLILSFPLTLLLIDFLELNYYTSGRKKNPNMSSVATPAV